MSSMSIIEQELRQFIEDSDNLSRSDRYVHLKAIFDKHLAMEKTEHLLTMSDFNHIISSAKQNFIHLTLPISISNKDLNPNDVSNVAMTESLIAYLNKAGVLRKLVKIDITTKTSK